MNKSSKDKPIMVAIAGYIFILFYNHSGTGSGKTYLCNRVEKEIGEDLCLALCFDSFYFGRTDEKIMHKDIDWDAPKAIDFNLAY